MKKAVGFVTKVILGVSIYYTYTKYDVFSKYNSTSKEKQQIEEVNKKIEEKDNTIDNKNNSIKAKQLELKNIKNNKKNKINYLDIWKQELKEVTKDS